MVSTLTKHQRRTFGPVYFEEGGRQYRIVATVRYDDECGNGHNTFSITAEIGKGKAGGIEACGCCHDAVAKHFPELAPLIKWHLCSSDGPLHYIANTVYHAGDRDCHGLRAGEKRQLRNGKTGQLAWQLEGNGRFPKYVDADECPTQTVTLRYVPWNRVGEGKDRDLDAARSCAVWPDATDDDLTEPGLAERLEARLPALLAEFRQAVESLGFVW